MKVDIYKSVGVCFFLTSAPEIFRGHLFVGKDILIGWMFFFDF